jgi:serine phosphatase RsbU (regulator of sigma subunit)
VVAEALTLEPELVMTRVAQALYSKARRKMTTMGYFVLDLETAQLKYVNAGHCYPFMLNAATGEVEEFILPSTPLGFQHKGRFKVKTVTFTPGSFLLMYSDGLPEALNASQNQFGYEHLKTILKKSSASNSSAAIFDAIKFAYRKHTRNTLPSDDVTMVILHCNR